MSKRADLLEAGYFGNRYRNATTGTNVSIAASSPTPSSASSRVHLETVWYSIKNWATGTAGQYSTALQVRGSAGTVLATVDHVLSSSTVANASITCLGFANPKRGTSLSVAFNTTAGSVTQSVNIAGWIEDVDG